MDGVGIAADMLRDVVRAIETNELIAKTLLSALALFILALFLRLYRSLLQRMVEARRLQEEAATRLYRIVELGAVVLIMFVIAYFLTRSPYLIYVIAGVALIVVASAWEAILNIIYYYVILFTGIVRQGNLIKVNGTGIYGRVADIRLFHTLLTQPGTPRSLYMVPHRILMSRGFTVLDEACTAAIRVTLDNVVPDDLDTIVEDLKARISEEARTGVIAVRGETSVRVYLESLTATSAVLKVVVETGYIVGREHRLIPLLYLLATSLREMGVGRFTVTLEGVRCDGVQEGAKEEVV